MRQFLPVVLAFALLAPSVLAQEWQSVGPFPADDPITATMHGVAVDPDGKVWLTPYFPTEEIITAEDDTVTTRAIYVFNEDGTEVDFSPIQVITVNGDPDTLFNASNGMETDIDGNILHTTGGAEDVPTTGWIYRIDYQTGEGLDKFQPQEQSQTQPAVDEIGTIYTANVLTERGPIRMYDNDLNFIDNAVDTTVGFSRSFEVTADGNTIYWGGFTNEAVWKYTRPDEFSPFNQVPDTTELRGMTAESFARHPVTNNIWISAGAGAQSPFVIGTWYEIDPETDEVLDSLVWDRSEGFVSEKPRGIAFSPDGNTAYAVMFDADSGAPSVQKFVFSDISSIEKVPGDLPESFTLKQNYPNPFNPSTNIEFDLHKAGEATLRVVDVLGREVAVLVDERLGAGTYSYTFDAANLPSGTYFYQLTAGGERQSASMILMK